MMRTRMASEAVIDRGKKRAKRRERGGGHLVTDFLKDHDFSEGNETGPAGERGK